MSRRMDVGCITFGPKNDQDDGVRKGFLGPGQTTAIAAPTDADARIAALEKELAEVTAIAKGLLAGDGSPTEADWQTIDTLPRDRRNIEIRQRYATTSDGKDTIMQATHWRRVKL